MWKYAAIPINHIIIVKQMLKTFAKVGIILFLSLTSGDASNYIG